MKFALGIDLGGSQVRAALVDETGNVLRRAAMATDVGGGPKSVVAQMRALFDDVGGNDRGADIAGIGVAAPGPLDSVTGRIIDIPTLPRWRDFPLRETLATELGLPVILDNDGIAAANGEWRFGAGRGLRHLVFVTVSTGIGGGVVVDGRLLHGRRGMAGHVGHMIIAPDGPHCPCGARGCFEAVASGSALGEAGRQAALMSTNGRLAGREAKAITSRDVVEAARAGDVIAVELMRREAVWLGVGFTSLIHLYSPEKLIVGGGVSQAFDLLRDGIVDVVQRSAMAPFRSVEIVEAALGDNAGLVGAAAFVFAQLGQRSGE
jgi:glucokinase